MTLFRLDSSIRTDGSVTRELADTVESTWRAEHPEGIVVRRDVGSAPLPVTSWIDAVAGSHTPAEQRTPAQQEAVALAASLADEVLAADALLIGAPLYNFGVPAQLKTWVDLLITDPRLAPGAEPPVAGRPGILVVARGGGYGPGTPREGWDHGTAWLRRILADVFKLDLHVVEAELTLAGVNPAMDAFRDLARASRDNAQAVAADHGRSIARHRRTAAA
jgi:FMN-dependent NADH-azoreductase